MTTIPQARAALLRLTLDWLCSDSAEVESCAAGATCVLGACRDSGIDSGTLPYLPTNYTDAPPPCFDVAECMGSASVVAPDPATCSIPSSASGRENVALRTANDGFCTGAGCYVVLDRTFAWQPGANSRLVLPPAACAQVLKGNAAIAYAVGCVPREADQPLCRKDDVGDSGAPPGPELLAKFTFDPIWANVHYSGIHVAVTAQSAYVSLQDKGLWQLPITGGTPTRIVEGDVRSVAATGDKVFYGLIADTGSYSSSSTTIYRVGSAAPTALSVTGVGGDLCVTSTRVFASALDSVAHMDAAGGPSAIEAVAGGGYSGLGACDGNAFYWLQFDALGVPSTTIRLRGKDTVSSAAPDILLTNNGGANGRGAVAVSPDAFFAWLPAPSSLSGSVVSVARTGGATTPFFDAEGVMRMAAAAGHVYAQLWNYRGNGYLGSIVGSRTSKPGPFVLVDQSLDARAMSVDDRYVYYLLVDGRFFRVPHP